MSVFEEQTADQLSGGVDTDAAFNQTAQQFVPTLADVINDPSRDASLPSCEAFAGEIVPVKKPRKPRKSKKLQFGQIGNQVQIDLHISSSQCFDVKIKVDGAEFCFGASQAEQVVIGGRVQKNTRLSMYRLDDAPGSSVSLFFDSLEQARTVFVKFDEFVASTIGGAK